MSEIEKMYENAGIKPIAEYCKHQCNNEFDDDACIGCKHIEKVEYPPFTAEKQIELIKWLAKHYGNIHILNNAARGFAIGIEGVSFNLKKFEEIIAMVLNTFWQDLTEEEQQQVKGILE